MNEIVDEMSEDEKAKMRSDREWVEKARDLIGLGKDHGMYETLDAVLRKMGVGRGQGKVQEPKYVGLDGTVTTKKSANKVQKLKALVGICVEAVGVETLGALLVGATRRMGFWNIGDEAWRSKRIQGRSTVL